MTEAGSDLSVVPERQTLSGPVASLGDERDTIIAAIDVPWSGV